MIGRGPDRPGCPGFDSDEDGGLECVAPDHHTGWVHAETIGMIREALEHPEWGQVFDVDGDAFLGFEDGEDTDPSATTFDSGLYESRTDGLERRYTGSAAYVLLPEPTVTSEEVEAAVKSIQSALKSNN